MKKILLSALFLSTPAFADLKFKDEGWKLRSFIYLSEKHPDRLLNIGEKLFSDERLAMSQKHRGLASEWQHRAAVLTSVSQFYAPGRSGKSLQNQQERAMLIIKKALLEDPSLLVRDAAVESIGRMNRMRPGIARYWRRTLEEAFLDEKNVVQGEGLFIRESILRLLKESGLKPSRKIRRAAKRDSNQQVRFLVDDWKTSTFDSIADF